MKSFFLLPNPTKDIGYALTSKIVAFLTKGGAKLYADEIHAAHLNHVAPCKQGEIPSDVEAILVLGGDGSVIHGATLALRNKLPILGVNLGHLGYLANIEPGDFEKLSALLQENVDLRSHIVLSVRIHQRDGQIIEATAVNEVVVCNNHDFNIAEIALTDMKASGSSVSYRADGLIVCTPLGSTAYSLSAGGPIIDSSADVFCVTPICPHSFFSRSILFSPDSVLQLKNESCKGLPHAVNIDGQKVHTLLPDEFVEIAVSAQRLTFVDIGHHGVLDVLGRKMMTSNVKF